MTKYNDDIMFDVTDPQLVEIEVRTDGRVYVNCDGKCRFRANVANNVIVVDDRTGYRSSKTRKDPLMTMSNKPKGAKR